MVSLPCCRRGSAISNERGICYRVTPVTIIPRSPSARITPGRAASGSRSASPPTSSATRSARGAGTTMPSTASRRRSATIRGAITATASASGGCSTSRTKSRCRLRITSTACSTTTRRRFSSVCAGAATRSWATAAPTPRTSTIFAGKRTKHGRYGRSPRPSRKTRAGRPRAGWGRAPMKIRGRPIS